MEARFLPKWAHPGSWADDTGIVSLRMYGGPQGEFPDGAYQLELYRQDDGNFMAYVYYDGRWWDVDRASLDDDAEAFRTNVPLGSSEEQFKAWFEMAWKLFWAGYYAGQLHFHRKGQPEENRDE